MRAIEVLQVLFCCMAERTHHAFILASQRILSCCQIAKPEGRYRFQIANEPLAQALLVPGDGVQKKKPTVVLDQGFQRNKSGSGKPSRVPQHGLGKGPKPADDSLEPARVDGLCHKRGVPVSGIDVEILEIVHELKQNAVGEGELSFGLSQLSVDQITIGQDGSASLGERDL